MIALRSPALSVTCVAAIALAVTLPLRAADIPDSICRLMLHEEAVELQDAELSVDLARSAFDAFDEIYQLIDGLWKADAIDRMRYLRAKYDRDAAKLELERADLGLSRQEALIEQLQLICATGATDEDEDRARKIREAYLRYLRADCGQQAKAIEVAETNLTFDRQWLESVLDLRDRVSTRQDVIRAELDVEIEEKSRDDAVRRTEICRAELKRIEQEPGPTE